MGADAATVSEASFVFWGPFAAFGIIVLLYLVWMWWVERGDAP